MGGDPYPGVTRAEWNAFLTTRPRNPSFTPLGVREEASFFLTPSRLPLVFHGCRALCSRPALLRLVDDDHSEIIRLVPISKRGGTFSPSVAGLWIAILAAEAGRLVRPERYGFHCVRQALQAIDGKGGRDARWAVAASAPLREIER